MKKVIFLFFCSIFIWTFYCPQTLSADDSVSVGDLDRSYQTIEKNIPETPRPAQISYPQQSAQNQVLLTKNTANSPTFQSSLQILGRSLGIVDVASTEVDAGNHVNKIGKLLYGHNSTAVFGNLSSLNIGGTFTVTENGVTKNYKVVAKTLYEKNPNGLLQLNGAGNYMKAIRDRALGHDLALMTCAGTSYGNGDASHRLVLFADAI